MDILHGKRLFGSIFLFLLRILFRVAKTERIVFMIYPITIPVHTVSTPQTVLVPIQQQKPPFPLLQIDTGSYIVGAQIQSGINFRPDMGIHSIQIGKYCAIAEDITFLIDLNHPYHCVAQGELDFFQPNTSEIPQKRKGQILIQNDVWIGHGATILGGVTIHNGAVIAANAVVTKDVPPYSIVGGNPAGIIGRGQRFSSAQIDALQQISWWDWALEQKKKFAGDFSVTPEVFIAKHIAAAQSSWQSLQPCFSKRPGTSFLLIPDLDDPYPVWKTIWNAFCALQQSDNTLYLYILPGSSEQCLAELYQILSQKPSSCSVVIQDTPVADERALFLQMDYFITTRSAQTVHWSCYADLCHVRVISGVDFPIFDRID